jgi:hypothetical protein
VLVAFIAACYWHHDHPGVNFQKRPATAAGRARQGAAPSAPPRERTRIKQMRDAIDLPYFFSRLLIIASFSHLKWANFFRAE